MSEELLQKIVVGAAIVLAVNCLCAAVFSWWVKANR